MAVTPGPIYTSYQKGLVQYKSGFVQFFRDSDESIRNEDIPIVIVFNGKHHFCSSKKVIPERVEGRRMEIMKQLIGNIKKLSLCFPASLPDPMKSNIQLLSALGKETSSMFNKWEGGEDIPPSQISLRSTEPPPLPSTQPSSSTSGTPTKQAREYDCDQCDKVFTRNHLLQWHMTVEHGSGRFCCALCPLSYTSPMGLKVHMAQKHPTEPAATVDSPGAKAGTKPKLYTCKYKDDPKEAKEGCPTWSTTSKARLKSHLIEVHKEDLPKEVCPKCSKEFSSMDNLNHHIKVCGKKDLPKDVACRGAGCKKKFRTVKDMEKHFDFFHTSKYAHLKCKKCGRQMRSKANLLKHEARHQLPPDEQEEEEEEEDD